MRFTSYLTAGALAALASAQTHTDCNPMEKECPNNPAMPSKFETNFKDGQGKVKGWKQTAGSLTYNGEGAQFTVNKQGEAPTIQSETYLHFGYVEVKAKSAPGQGIISSIVLQSEDLDEVDWEFLGGVNNKVQMNYFGKGNTTTYDRMLEGDVADTKALHSYALNWTSDALTWIIDGKPVRTLNRGDANGGKNYPQTPCTVRIGIWAGGDPTNEPGVITWAGGKTDYTKAPFTMVVDSVNVQNYSPGKEYRWKDKTGSFESIEVIGKGEVDGAPQNSQVLEPSAAGPNKGLQSGVDVPKSTNAPAPTDAPASGAPTGAPQATGAPYSNGTAPADDCSCGIATVTVTGPPPADVPSTLVSSATPPPSSAAPPVTTDTPATTDSPVSPPPESTSVGIVTDTAPAPSMPIPTNPTGGLTPSNTTTAPPGQFTGAASRVHAGAFVGFAAAAMLFI
jgi:hypothetical protein